MCGHLFCEKCFFEASLFKSKCSVCRDKTNILKAYNIHLIEHLVKNNLSKLDADYQKAFSQNLNLDFTWRNQRYLSSVNVNQKLDILEAPDIWCKATVLSVTELDSKKTLVKVHYDQWDKRFDELIPLSSKRIAPNNFVLSHSRFVIRR